MLIIEKNLKGLALQQNICDENLVESFCCQIRMSDHFFFPRKNAEDKKNITVVYGRSPEPSTLFDEKRLGHENLLLSPGASVLGCSQDKYEIPPNYFGLVQTKGTLARLFVAITCNDGQVEPGFKGKITLEITNHSPWNIEIPYLSEIGQLYLFKCSSDAERPYQGRYGELANVGPTIPIWERDKLR